MTLRYQIEYYRSIYLIERIFSARMYIPVEGRTRSINKSVSHPVIYLSNEGHFLSPSVGPG